MTTKLVFLAMLTWTTGCIGGSLDVEDPYALQGGDDGVQPRQNTGNTRDSGGLHNNTLPPVMSDMSMDTEEDDGRPGGEDMGSGQEDMRVDPTGDPDMPDPMEDMKPPVNPGDDPCSGNPFTATTPTTAKGMPPAGINADQQRAQDMMDEIRNRAGLNPISLQAQLNECAQAHSDYCSTNSSWCPGWHDEVPGNPGFTGADFGTRCRAAGYGGARFEVMAPGVGPDASVNMWMNSVYHRTPFLIPGVHEAGYGGASQYVTMDFGCCGQRDASLVTNYPVHGQTGFWRSFSGREGPPPPAPSTGWPSSGIISVVFPSKSGVSITRHQIFDASCNELDHMAGGANLPNDAGFSTRLFDSQLVMYANDPFERGEQYTVNVEYTINDTPGHRTFQFTVQ